MRQREIFVLGLDDFQRPLLEELPQASECRFHGLLPMERIRQGDKIPIGELIDEALAELDRFDGPVDAIVGFWDFPINCLVPILSERLGLPHKPLAGVVACEHKYWARVVEELVVPGAIPRSSGPGGETSGSSASKPTARGSRRGCRTSAATSTGDMARSGSTSNASAAPSWR